MAEVGDDRAARLAQPFVVRRALMSAVRRQIDPADARIPDGGDHFLGIVGASVADDEQLKNRWRSAAECCRWSTAVRCSNCRWASPPSHAASSDILPRRPVRGSLGPGLPYGRQT